MASTALVKSQTLAFHSLFFKRRVSSYNVASLKLPSLRVFQTNLRRTQRRAGAGVRAAAAERPLWLPGYEPAQHLDGTLPGDFGFDPLKLGKDPADLRWYVQAELVHARFAMLGAAGILGQEILRKLGRDIPIWYETGAATYFAPASTLFIVQMLLFGWVESKRYFDFVNPGSQKDPWFFWIEPALEGLEPGYPGGPLFNISGFGTGLTKKDNVQEMRTKEIKNGRLAMVAVVGFIVQALVTRTGPIENLLDHIADPLNTTVVRTFDRELGGKTVQNFPFETPKTKAPAVAAASKASSETKASPKELASNLASKTSAATGKLASKLASKTSAAVVGLSTSSPSLAPKAPVQLQASSVTPKSNAPAVATASKPASSVVQQAAEPPAVVVPKFGASSIPPTFCSIEVC